MRARPTTTWRASCDEEIGKGAFPAVLHCFTGGRELAFTGIELGLYVSFTGILTFKNSDELRAIARDLPADRILVETDAPYLAPGKFRGKRCEPAYVVETAQVLAETRGVSPDEIARQTTENFFRLFSKVPRPPARGGRHDVLTLHHSRLRLVHGRAAAGARLGRLRPEQPEKPPAPDLASGRAPRPERHHPGPGRHLAGPARAAARRRRGLARRRADHPRARRPHATASTTSGRCSSASAAGSTCTSTSRPRALHARALRLLLRDAAGQRISADRDRAPADARRAR